MKTPFKNIQVQLRLNRWVVLSVVIASGLVTVVALILMAKIHREALDNAFIINGNGNVIPLVWADQKQNMEVEALAHLEQFHRWFYGVDAGSYERNMERALWLGNATVAEVYQQKKANGFYNRLLQYSLVQKVERIDSKIAVQQDSMTFRTRIIIEINRGSVTDVYELVTTGRLIPVERNFPHNPHGLLITDFFENSLRKIKGYETTEK
ncbi:conjugal transfer protein TraK [Flagellimonas lutimaris]|uniref:Conjugal transfer protein TraK n=1 Tax=Flagellimonas lutimaris TaxID=475082 RepID=A0A3A1N538_9FLAO|nr:conjugal transfer protein TraK [Allomuricauda lutimaris]RIV31509.1 conjugal transfer protein TraK [Allomuricauda lutimaris]